MTCERCHGLMIQEYQGERDRWLISDKWPKPQFIWRCLTCGNLEDEIIAYNRALQSGDTRRWAVWARRGRRIRGPSA